MNETNEKTRYTHVSWEEFKKYELLNATQEFKYTTKGKLWSKKLKHPTDNFTVVYTNGFFRRQAYEGYSELSWTKEQLIKGDILLFIKEENESSN
jgi:hypothetical protein